ncbi:hypothetical protein Poly51_47450 [Rubripirellula tenax]|uniref:Secreted protein n=1 Tax=Rubripirellula tenax TaxID=2528015 RepID=A0A5C6EMH5_9BACT|nr:hypothetical protein [Rubripirellula tenax]TWU48841.1 hypothetical protein Poly51_47450 [Rubripirellula tenax]
MPALPHRCFLAGIIACLLAGFTGDAALAGELEWDLKVGDQFDVSLVHSTVSESVVGEFKADQTYRYQLGTTWTVTDVDDQRTATIEKQVRSIQLKIVSVSPIPMQIEVDTAKSTASGKTFSGTEGETLLKHLQSLVGKTLHWKMKPNGETQALPIPQATQDAIDAFPESDYVLQMFDLSSIAESETSYVVVLPDHSPEPGETWTQESDLAVHENPAFVTLFRYVGETDRDGKRLSQFTTNTTPKRVGDRKLPPDSPDAASVIKQTGEGKCFFDREARNFVDSAYRSRIVTTSSAQQSVITSDVASTIRRKP